MNIFQPKSATPVNSISDFQIKWQSPSNIALVKYWGKFGRQLPKNASLSFTLDKAHTITSLSAKKLDSVNDELQLDFEFEGNSSSAFEARIRKFLLSIEEFFPFLKQFHYDIKSENSFPHSSGIASSASAMSALALCFCSLEKELLGSFKDEQAFMQKASFISRLGSGSACRSVYPIAGVWGESSPMEESSDFYAVKAGHTFHPVFKVYKDAILIISEGEKKVSSTAGHALMNNHPQADFRYDTAEQNLIRLMDAMKHGDLEEFMKITEAEALMLHALMMTSDPAYILMQPHTISVIHRLQEFRNETKIPVCFTLDAGPNVHMLYPAEYAVSVEKFIEAELVQYCQDGRWIKDQVGLGPKTLSK